MTGINEFFDFFIPRFCIHCKTKLQSTERFICTICFGTIIIPDANRLQHEFNRKFRADNLISDFSSPFLFEKDGALQSLIHALKYKENFRVGIFLGKLIADSLKEKINSWNADLLVPVPLHRLKKAERGYNQSLFLAKGISKNLKIPIQQRLISRNKFTHTQTELSLEERKQNVQGAFSIKKKGIVEGKKIILVDDVITTGATISEIGKILIGNGAEKVFAVSVAIAD